jgi:signal transduction histidine kinase
LIVDDDPDIARMVSLAGSLAFKEEGYDFIIADSGKKAVETINREVPDVVLLDLNLPDMNGKEILEMIKGVSEDIETIVITGYGNERVAVDLMKAGAIDFISKPFEIEILIKSIKDALRLRDSRIENRRSGGLSSLETFFPFLAHEIRNPLHAIAGALAILQKRIDLGDEILARSINIINEEVQHLTGFVQDCLNFVRIPSSGYFVMGQVNEIISIVMSIIAHMAGDVADKVKITYRLDAELPMTHVNYEEIKEAFINLVRNSLESMPNGGELIVETKVREQSEKKSILVVFSDCGSGIRKEDRKRLFTPFFTTKSRGSGLGLAICRRIIVERHGGRMDIESEEGVGTKVTIELPIRSSEEKIV